MNLAIIPARGGSKRIARKNIKHFSGKPIVAWSIETAIRSGLFEEIMVSTDDVEIKSIAVQYGAKVPFIRSRANSNDFAGTEDVILEVLNQYALAGQNFDLLCCIYPTAPLISVDNLKKAKDRLIDGNFDSVLPILRFSYPILRALKVVNDKVKMAWPENEHKRSQDFTTYYQDAGQFYWIKVEKFLKAKNIHTDNTGYIELTELEVQDIDNLSDWEIAEFKFNYLKKTMLE